MEPWYKVATPRSEVRKGRSFNPDEFAIALEQVVSKTAPEDYRNPVKFFSRTYFTKALREHAGMVLRRLSGKTENTAPVLTLITQFGGGKTHTLTSLYHLVHNAKQSNEFQGVPDFLSEAGLSEAPQAKVGVFVGNAWDPQEGKETPWIDLARQLAGDKGVSLLGPSAMKTPPGTEALSRVFDAAGGSVLVLFDEVLNFVNRHRGMADQFHAFIQNLTVAMTGTIKSAAVISLPRSQVEMTDYDIQWQDRITKVVRRVAKDLIALDETEISEVVRRRLFEDLGSEKIRKNVAKLYADWCFERRAQLPPEWTAVDTASTEAKAREYLRSRFESCYPFHPATLSVFQRKWAILPHFQQTRGALAMLAQWISLVYKQGYEKARREPLITIGSAPIEISEFRSIVLGQLGEARLIYAIDADISGMQSHARSLDADTKGTLRDIHRRVATAILFESSGGQKDKIAHLPELRFSLGEPEIDTTSIDSAALSLESKAFFIRKIGSDGFQIRYQPTLKKVVNDRRASLDEDTEIKPAMRTLVQKEFERGASIPIISFPTDSASIQDSPRLTIIVIDPEHEWNGASTLRQQISEWTKQRGKSPRLYPGSLVWCVKKPGRDIREKIELWLAWKRVIREVIEGTLGTDFDRADKAEIQAKVADAEEAAKDEVWGGYRFVIISDNQSPDGLKVIDLGAGHASGSETLCGRIITALKTEALLNESVGAGYIDRNWPPALKESGAWPLTSLRQSFLNGSLTRLLDPDAVLKNKIMEFVGNGDFGLASGQKPDGLYERIWFNELISIDEVAFEPAVFLLTKNKAKVLKKVIITGPPVEPEPPSEPVPPIKPDPKPPLKPASETCTLRLVGTIPPELWNRLGTKILPKLRSGEKLSIGIDFRVSMKKDTARNITAELNQIIDDLGLLDKVEIEEID
ncbi:ATP-binding protein [candidate division WS5 bacterium]|uniref:ATP-binding protein n=1 Tax=candidate division WS5 bacterium TaxID=2093353 RepID=A0A419DDV7_9BACT|nr:MAG: ATP-binding protein [candidate division WS5 bacterium]